MTEPVAGTRPASRSQTLAPANGRRSAPWVGRDAVCWVLDDAPGLPGKLVATLLAVARHAGEDGRNSCAHVSTLAYETRKSIRQVQRDLAELRKIGLLLPGDASIAADFPIDRRPEVYDLPIHLKRGDICDTPVPERGDVHVTSRGDAHDATGCHVRPDGVTPTSPPYKEVNKQRTNSLSKPGERDPMPPEPNPKATPLALIVAAGKTPDEAPLWLDAINAKHGRPSPAWIRTVARNGDLPAILDGVAYLVAARASPEPDRPPVPEALPWCGQCDFGSRRIEIVQANGNDALAPCPACSPRRSTP